MEAKGWTAVRIFRLAVLGILAVALLTGGTLRLRDALANEDVAAPDFNLLTEEELAGTPYVSGNVELVLDCFAESYTTRNDVRVSDESDELYYLVPAAPTDSEGYYHCTYLLCLEVRPERVIAVQDGENHHCTAYPWKVCIVFVLCTLLGGEFRENLETSGSGWFALDELPELDLEKTTPEQLEMCFQADRARHWETRLE